MRKSVISILIIISVVMGLIPVISYAATTTHILAIGDSLTEGYRLPDPESQRFTTYLDGYTVNNMSVTGYEAPHIIAQLEGEGIRPITEDMIIEADYITITCGGNDMMELLYGAVASIWNTNYPNNPIDVSEVPIMLENKNPLLMLIALQLMDESSPAFILDDPVFTEGVATFTENLNLIVSKLHSVNPDAKVVFLNNYNPYEEFENAPSAIFRPIYSGMEIGINRLNDAVKSNAEIGNYIVVDIKAAFDSYTGTDDLHNADPSTENMNVDFHPTPAGHRLIADTLLSVLSTITPEDITNIDIIHSDEGLMLQVKACFKNRADKMITGSVWCAVYDNYGRMTGIDTLRINDVAPNTASDMVFTIALADPYDEDVRIGFFLLDSTSFIPLISDRIYN